MNPNERQLLLGTISKIKNIAKKRFSNDVYNNIFEIFNLLEKNEQVVILREFTIICFIVDDDVLSESKENIILDSEGQNVCPAPPVSVKEEIEMKEQAALKFWIIKIFVIISLVAILFFSMLGFIDPVKFFASIPNSLSNLGEVTKIIFGMK